MAKASQNMASQNTGTGGGSGGGSESGGHSGRGSDSTSDVIRHGVDIVRDEASRQGTAALGAIREGAGALGEQAREQAEAYTESGKRVVTDHLDTFASAIRKASDELSSHDQTLASQFIRQAAGGLESLSRSVDSTSFGDLVDSVRSFGRRNPAAFIGVAVLAGLALGRFARASSRQDEFEDDDGDEDWRSGQPGGSRIRDENGRFVPRSGGEMGRSSGGSGGPQRQPQRAGGRGEGRAASGAGVNTGSLSPQRQS